MDEAFVAILNRCDPAARFHFSVGTKPFRAVNVRQEVAQRSIARHAGRFAEKYLAHINGDVLVRIHIIRQRYDFGIKSVFITIAAAITVKLDVCNMSAMTLERFEGFECGLPIAGHAQVVAVNVHGMRQAELVNGARHVGNNLSRSYIEMLDV